MYHSYRLQVLGACRRFKGIVREVRPEDDGDHHILIAPDPGFDGFLNQDNRRYQHGWLVVETMPGQHLPIPSVGDHVMVFGTWVLDTQHGWREIHPIWAIRNTTTGVVRFDLPPATPVYGSAEGGGAGGGGRGCDPSYPTVCIPSPPPDLDCGDIAFRNFKVVSQDDQGFDGDHDGVGCET